ncbi:MAG TPA: hypothetical protein VKA84_17370 [Gemmatimonadaceae bacterium]|nr:hypothetical protein [Gemmatimonadaceae bacterium]
MTHLSPPSTAPAWGLRRRLADGAPGAGAHDEAGAVRDAYRAVGVPESYLIAPDGTVLWRHAGGLHDTPKAAREAVEKALK